MRTRIRFLMIGLLAGSFPGCLVEEGDGKCDENQRWLGGFCVCVDGAVPASSGIGCEVCGKNQTVVNNQCTCEEGFVSSPSGACVPVPEGVGAPCDASMNECPTDFPTCHAPRDGGAVCTKECTDSSECPEPFGCTLSVGTQVCLPAPSGLYAPCMAEEDCAGFGASYCAITGVCLEPDCDADRPCWGGSVCCDYRSYGAPTVCVPPSGLENGACYLGVPQIPPNDGAQ